MKDFAAKWKPWARRLWNPHSHQQVDLYMQVSVPDQATVWDGLPSDFVEMILCAARFANEERLERILPRIPLDEDRAYLARWPGEHYRLLWGVAKVLQPRLILEVGTWRGASALVMSEHAEQIITYDVVPLESIPGHVEGLLSAGGAIEQRIGDLATPAFFESQSREIRTADLVFIDGPKDGHFESLVVPKVLASMKPGALLILDDVRFASMRDLWLSLNRPRIDVGSFGHSSGTGIILA